MAVSGYWHQANISLIARIVGSWHETAVLCVAANVCSWGKSGRAADITAMTRTPSGLRGHSRDLPIGLFVADRATEAWYHPSIA